MVNLLLALPGFLGNPAIKEEPRVPCGKFSLGFSRLFQAFQETPESRKNQDVPEIIPVRSSGLFFAHKEKPGKRGNFLLIFPGFPGNPGIKEEPGCASNHSGQKLRAFCT